MKPGSHALGIDLGTTHCALAVTPLLDSNAGAPEVLAIPQVVNPGEVESRPLLPSFLYLPSEHELQNHALALPWDSERADVTGAFAHAQGARVPGRLVHSAKSWLGVSTLEGPPCMKRKITRLACGAKWGG